MTSRVGSCGGAGGPGAMGPLPDMSRKTTDQLKDILQDTKAPFEDRYAALQELVKRASAAQQASMGSDEGDDIWTLLRKLLSGQITPEELAKLASMLGVDPAALEGLKGGGAGAGGSSDKCDLK